MLNDKQKRKNVVLLMMIIWNLNNVDINTIFEGGFIYSQNSSWIRSIEIEKIFSLNFTQYNTLKVVIF